MIRFGAAALVTALFGCASVTPPPATTPDGGVVVPPSSGSASPLTSSGDQKSGDFQDFGTLTAGSVFRVGFFDTYEKGNHLYLMVPPERYGKDLLLTFTVAQGVGARWLLGGLMLNIFDGYIVAFERHGDNVYLLQRPHRFTAPKGSPLAKAVDLSFGSSVLASAKIESFGKDSAAVIDIRDWVVSDLSAAGDIMRLAILSDSVTQRKATFDKDRSFVESVKVFPRNLNVRAKLTYTPSDTLTLPAVPDTRYIPISIFYSFAALPVQPMTPRLADDRLGYFVTASSNRSLELYARPSSAPVTG